MDRALSDDEYSRLLFVLHDYDAMEKRIKELETRIKKQGEVEARLDSFEIGEAGKRFKHYLDPLAPREENDRSLAEQARNFLNAGGALPKDFSPTILEMARASNNVKQGGQ